MNTPAPTPVRIAITGAAGRIAYALAFRIAKGHLFGPRQPVELVLFDLPHLVKAMHGVRMELEDCAFAPLAGVTVTDDPALAFRDARLALLLGARSREAGMARGEVLAGNARIFATLGAAISGHAREDCRVLVVANPCDTNTNVAIRAARRHGRLAPHQFAAMMRLDHNRALAQLAKVTGQPVSALRRMVVWGNHSGLVRADDRFVRADGVAVTAGPGLLAGLVSARGESVREALGAWAAASAANATLEQARDWWFGTGGEWTTMGVPSDGAYGVPEGLVFGFPVTVEDGRWRIVRDLPLDDATRGAIDANVRELTEELEVARGALPDLFD